jgi:hypothetical protein
MLVITYPYSKPNKTSPLQLYRHVHVPVKRLLHTHDGYPTNYSCRQLGLLVVYSTVNRLVLAATKRGFLCSSDGPVRDRCQLAPFAAPRARYIHQTL